MVSVWKREYSLAKPADDGWLLPPGGSVSGGYQWPRWHVDQIEDSDSLIRYTEMDMIAGSLPP